jgi:pyruvate kinase
MSKTQIVATIGPASNSPEVLRRLWQAGMSVARLNGAHNELRWHAETIDTIRRTLPDVPVLLDIPGRKIRTVQLSVEPRFKAGETIVLTTDPFYAGDDKAPINYSALHEDLSPGDIVLADDGTLRFTVTAVRGRDIVLRAECDGQLKSRKGINVPFVRLRTPLITERDRDMVAFARQHGVDFLGISFVESARHVDAMRALTGGKWPRIVAKIENQAGLDNLAEILEAADAIMIDRGDLSVETNVENVALYQKRVLQSARAHSKPVIVATEMLHNMIESRIPTKAEVSDITNAVLDGCAATMLSGETAIGAYPVEAVATMRRVANAARAHVLGPPRGAHLEPPRAMGDAVALICQELSVTKIVAVTMSGYAARLLATLSLRQPILAVSNDAMAARSFNLLAGVKGIHLDIELSRTSTDHIARCLEILFARGELTLADVILVVSVAYPRSGNRMNLIQTHRVADLAESLSWQLPDALTA